MEKHAMTTTLQSDPIRTPREAAEQLGVKVQTLAKWRTTKRYELPYHKVGGAIRYRQSDLDRFVNKQRCE
jgi:excisionase family DNA binding protein